MTSEKRDHLFLDDLHVGQTFTSPSHSVDTEQIKRFAEEFDPQPFHLRRLRLPNRCLLVSPPAAGIQPRSRCDYSWTAARL
jgi:hypothetical protein